MTRRTVKVTAFELTADETRAMEHLRSRAVSAKWAREEDFLPLTHSSYRTSKGASVSLDASLESVEHLLSAALRPDRALVKAVRYKSGEIVQVLDVPEPDALEEELEGMAADIEKTASLDEARAKARERGQKLDEDRAKEKEKPKAGVTVTQPNVGCPMPDFHEADRRASFVLETFLTDAQRVDYRDRGAFVCTGADTGRPYLICNREGPALMREQAMSFGLTARASFRQIFDLEARRPLCIHDWTVPPPEEMLALMLCLTLPGLERQMLRLPEVFES